MARQPDRYFTKVRHIGDATLYLGDCLDLLPAIHESIGLIDAVVTDPPYGVNDTHARHLSKVKLKSGERAGQKLGFNGINADDMLALAKQFVSMSKSWVIFTSEWKFMHVLDEAGILIRFGIWRKPDGAPQFTGDRPGMGWEGVAICHKPGKKTWNGGGKHAFWTFPKGQNNSGHPTGKPLGLFKSFINDFTNEGEIVLDPFMGSGTTGVACALMGRRFVGIEIDPEYFDIACERIEEAYAQPDMFVTQPSSESSSQLSLDESE